MRQVQLVVVDGEGELIDHVCVFVARTENEDGDTARAVHLATDAIVPGCPVWPDSILVESAEDAPVTP